MNTSKRLKSISLVLVLGLIFSALFSVMPLASSSDGQGITESAGWFESAYAEWAAVPGAEGYKAYISLGSGAWEAIDSELVRATNNGYRVDAVGLKAGSYKIKITPVIDGTEKEASALLTDTLTVSAYDRSGYAHFGYTSGVGAYNDDGTLKDGAIVLYVTEENKETVTVTSKDGTTVTGIGNILNSVGKDVGGGVSSKGGLANTNADIIRKLATDGTPLVIRIIGRVKAPKGLTAYNSADYGGSVGDNGFMARMSGGKDVTIEGIGNDAIMDGWGLHFICQTADYAQGLGRSFEVRNIAFKNVPEDCVGMEGQQEDSTLTAPVERCWIHHCSFYAPVIANPAESDKDGGDGACDFKRGQYFTNSYCYYVGYHKTNLVGSSDSSMQYHMTYHHNYWQNCESRGPLARQANIHMYNNVFEGQTSYCMNPRANAYIFSEYNLFYKSKNPVDVKSGAVKSYGDSFASCTGNNNATVVTDRATKVSSGNRYENFDTNSSLSYIPSGDYQIEEDIGAMKAVVLAYAGVQKKGTPTPDSVNTSVIPTDRYPTSALVLDYTATLSGTTIPSSGTYNNILFNVTKTGSDYITIGGDTDGCNIVFYVDTAVNVTVSQHSSSSVDLVLCDQSGKSLLIGGGTVENIPHGYYFIQSNVYDVGTGKFKEAKICGLTVIAVDKNAATNPIPTPPSGGTDNPGTDTPGTDDPGTDTPGADTPGGSITSGTVITPDSELHSFTDHGKTDPEGFFTISGNTSTSKGSVTFNGETLTTCLKIESSTNISFNPSTEGTLILVFGGTTNASGQKIRVDGTSFTISQNQILELALSTGAHAITKDNSINLFYMAFVPKTAEHTHSYEESVTLEPTCTESGEMTYTCECGESYVEQIAPVGHSYSADVIKEATCTKEGTTVYSCDCGDEFTESTDPLGHIYESSELTAPTCTESGEIAHTCVRGDSYYIETVAPTGHSYEETETREPTCTEPGVQIFSCRCGESYVEEREAPLGHSYSDGRCTVCGASDPADPPEDKPDDPTDDPIDDPTDEPTEKPTTPGDGEEGENGTEPDTTPDDEPEELGFFARIWQAILDFFRRIFGIKKD